MTLVFERDPERPRQKMNQQSSGPMRPQEYIRISEYKETGFMAQTAEHSTLARPLISAMPARRTLAVLAGSLLIAACAHVSVPLFFTPVPITLQPFAVVLLGLLMGPGLGAATCAAYLLEGALGLPVFTPQGPGGLLQIFGPTGGYLMSYPAAAALAGLLARMRSPQTLWSTLAGATASNLLILTSGACWLALAKQMSAATVAHIAVLPFLGEDAVKVVLATLIAWGWRRSRVDRTHTPGRS